VNRYIALCFFWMGFVVFAINKSIGHVTPFLIGDAILVAGFGIMSAILTEKEKIDGQ